MEHRASRNFSRKTPANAFVWDNSNPYYKKKNAQENAGLNIARECGLEGKPQCVKAKWRDLQDTYRSKES